jgi:hypothetical protein
MNAEMEKGERGKYSGLINNVGKKNRVYMLVIYIMSALYSYNYMVASHCHDKYIEVTNCRHFKSAPF